MASTIDELLDELALLITELPPARQGLLDELLDEENDDDEE